MGADIVIRAEGLSKKYLIGHLASNERIALRDEIARIARGFARAAGDMLSGRPLVQGDEVEEFWALKDLNFEIKRGDVVGVIGRNGAGKSTLLKILSRITEPSAGRVEIKGRVASLLEVGTGFHPELTGRENVYLNGAILGMSRAEIKRKFDQIVAFAEVDRFLDTPVKRYSSGMYVRLAFAVAAHLDPEILVVDEVLAVGDAEFQKKCLGKLGDVAADHRTVFFVSHNIAAVKQLCKLGFFLQEGTLQYFGATWDAVSRYLQLHVHPTSKFSRATPIDARAFVKDARIGSFCSTDNNNRTIVELQLEVESQKQMNINVDVRLKDANQQPIAVATTGGFDYRTPVVISQGICKHVFHIDFTGFAVGVYFISIDLTIPSSEYIDRCEDCLKFVNPEEHWTISKMPFRQSFRMGTLLLDLVPAP